MTSIFGNAAFSPSFDAAFASGIGSASALLAAGIFARYANPLGAGANAVGQLPSQWSIGLGTAAAPQQPLAQWTASTGPNGQGSIDLGDGYTLQLNENNSEVTIRNAATGETTQIWGDPHVNVDGQHVYDFWGTTTFTLDNGTKITINTEQGIGNPNVYFADQLVVTKGDQAIIVNGLSQQHRGDMTISMGNNGRVLDALTRDGFVLQENAAGSGWRSELTGAIATQADLNTTRPGAAYGPGSNALSLGELGQVLSGFLLLGLFAGMA